ncbi:YciI family protein [Kribbella sp. NPDC048928]|uniref:YciI family protein n=1 Tax=Kribbella sp. NPDC048928 TaxID=3364111 RepID=UPI003718652E
MRYLVSVIDDATTSATDEELEAVGEFNERLQADGHWVFAGGLSSPSDATVIDARGVEPIVTDGPFVEAKEYMGGLWVLEAPDLDVALKLASGASKVCNRRLEVRPFL